MYSFSSVPEKILYAGFLFFSFYLRMEREQWREWKAEEENKLVPHFKGIICSMWKYEEKQKNRAKKCVMDSLFLRG